MSSVDTRLSTPKKIARTGARVESDRESVVDQFLGLLSSVRFGIVMLIVLLLCCMIGMLIMQNNVEGFAEYFEQLTPSQRAVYTALGFFDIYHSWYFTLLLGITALNIILASIDRFPVAWRYVHSPRRSATPEFVKAQAFNAVVASEDSGRDIAEKVMHLWRKMGMRCRLSEANGGITVFGQRNLWNRFGAYVVHLALLMIFVGGFLTSRYGIGGVVEIVPGRSADTFFTYATGIEGDSSRPIKLPFVIECNDLQQQLIRPEGGLDPMNTIDWLSFVTIKDGGRDHPGLVHLNEPLDYRGYRFFQSSFQPVGNARQVTVTLGPEAGRTALTIPRNGSIEVEGIGTVSYVAFYPDFVIENGKPASASGDYNNPVAELSILSPDGAHRRVLAFNRETVAEVRTAKDIAILESFEKVAGSHSLTVQYDPGRIPVYAGFSLLFVSLCLVFFFSHQRVWLYIESNGSGSILHFGGNASRNRAGFENKFNLLVASVIGKGERE